VDRDNASPTPPPFAGVLETVLYVADEERAEAFYSGVLGMRLLDKEPGRGLFYRAGKSVFLLFRPGATSSDGKLPPHGAAGPIHVCFRVARCDYASWKEHLAGQGVRILREVDWTNGRSFYFEDPDGNLLEIADADIWPR